jgi:hypothetical protein
MTAEHVSTLVAHRLRNLVATVDARMPRSAWLQEALTELADDLVVARVNVPSQADDSARDGESSAPSSVGGAFTGPTAFCFQYEQTDIPPGVTLDAWRHRRAA